MPGLVGGNMVKSIKIKMISHTKEFEPQPKPISAWDNAVIYQIYPRSFLEVRDSNEKPSGEGSLKGVTERLDYLKSLQVDAIWLSPFFPSPLKDGGYDVSDYENVDPRYGDLDDFKELVTSAKEAGIKVMIDYVLNHTSDEHSWFQESRSSCDNPKADWYIWADPKSDGSPPNNWASVFSLENLKKRQSGKLDLSAGEPTPYNSAWAFDEARGQYYLHSFGSFQPDLNWSNPEVRQAMKDVLRFWLDLGIDGFRVDAVNYIGKDMSLRDESPNLNYREGRDNPYERLEQYHSSNYPAALYDYLKELTSVLHEPKYLTRDTRLVFEAYADDDIINMLNAIDSDHASAFNFVRLDAKWSAREQERLIDNYYRHLPAEATPNNVNGNHDKPRLASRLGDKGARLAALINATLPGQMFIYNGEEAGMTDVELPESKQQDKLGFRDSARTPMQWTAAKNAGFSEAPKSKLWLPVGVNYLRDNVAAELARRHSSLWLYKALLYMKTHYPELVKGEYHPLISDQSDVLAYARRQGDDQLIVAANFADHPLTVRLSGTEAVKGRIILSTDQVIDESEVVDLDRLRLRGQQGVTITTAV